VLIFNKINDDAYYIATLQSYKESRRIKIIE
jgi:hypothetical protein